MKTLSFVLALALTLPSFALELAKDIKFSKACTKGEQFVITAVGDILLHSPLQKKAAKSQDFKVLWDKFIPYIDKADMAYANLEGPTAYGVNASGENVKDPGHVFDGNVYGSYPAFNYHPTLVNDISASGFDVVSTANNHALDRKSLGIDRTIDNLDQVGLQFTGTRKKGESEDDRPWYTVVERNGLKIAWIACTFSTNGIPDRHGQVLDCFAKEDREKIRNIVRSQKSQVDAVFVAPHWGVEYELQPQAEQVGFAKEMLDLGATAIIGNHPHVIQPMDKYLTKDGRETFIIYSLGNFVSGQSGTEKKATILLFLGLTKTKKGTLLNGVKFMPAYMTMNSDVELRPMEKGRSEGAAELQHITKVFAKNNLVYFNEEVVPNSECP